MKAVCAWCKADLGEREPLDNPATTHGLCPACEQREEDRARLARKARECGVPEHLAPDLVAYVVDGCPTSGCLEAILANDLMEAFGRADEDTAAGMKAVCTFIYNYVPTAAHGSYEKVAAWLELKQAKRAPAAP